MKITAILTGRGNNTLKDKNLLSVLGKPVLYYPANAARNVEEISAYYCSSDDINILDTAEELGYKRIVRPEELGAPDAQHVDVIMHSLKYLEKINELPDIAVILLANNVTIKSEWIKESIKMMKDDRTLSAVVPIYEDNDHHPLRAKRIINGRLEMYEENCNENISTNRQDLTKCYFLSHNFWTLNVKNFMENPTGGQKPWSFMGNNIGYIEINESIDIHKKVDLLLAEEWVKNNLSEV